MDNPRVIRLCLAALIAAVAVPDSRAIGPEEIPVAAPPDALMAGAEEMRQVQTWASRSFDGAWPGGTGVAVGVEVRRQDHSVLRFGESCIDTPIRIANREFMHGLGTHANSEIVLHLPRQAKEFRSWVGIDNNPNTGGTRGSVQFSIEIGGSEVFRTPILRATNTPLEIKVPIPPGTQELTLKVDSTPDGPAHDHADWADACVITEDARVSWADEDRQPFVAAGPPFSFRYGGQASTSFLREWKQTTVTKETEGRLFQELTWIDPKTSLRVKASACLFKRYPAAEWVLEFEKGGDEDTPLLDEIAAADLVFRTGYQAKPATLHQLVGDVCEERSFRPFETPLELNKPLVLKPTGGRSSSGTFPFFDLQYGNEGAIVAVGWSGQWQASFSRSSTGPTEFKAGLELLSLRMRPGEKFRTPRILVMPWAGDRLLAHNRFRRLMLFENGPKHNGRPWSMPLALQSFDRYIRTEPNWGTEALQIRVADAAANIGCDTHWLDAAWFEGGFPNGVGNWYCPKDRFPTGLKPISEACHNRGLKFLVWFEPERAAAGSEIAREHPEFVLGGDKGGLFNLGQAQARDWIGELLSRRIAEFGVDIYRNDFNMDPLPSWRQGDSPDRQGWTEAAYVQGHYALWDELLARHPGLMIDNCAGGGRRIDLETCARSLPFWHSDTGCSPGHADWNQSHICGLSQYVPLFGACAWSPSAYEVRSAATAGLVCQFAVLDPDFSFEQARTALAEARENQKYWYGDFYPLAAAAPGPAVLCACQLHRSDLDSGIVLAFRRAECPFPELQANLRAINADKWYQAEFIDEAFRKQERRMQGKELATDLELRLPTRGTSLLVRYRPDVSRK